MAPYEDLSSQTMEKVFRTKAAIPTSFRQLNFWELSLKDYDLFSNQPVVIQR